MAKRKAKKTEASKPRKRVRKPRAKRVAPEIVNGLAELTDSLEAQAPPIVPSFDVVRVPDRAFTFPDVAVASDPLDCEVYHHAEVVPSPLLDAVDPPQPQTSCNSTETFMRCVIAAACVILLASILAAVLGSCSKADGAEPVHPYVAARSQAIESGKPLVVLLESDNCGPCKQLVKDWGVHIRVKGVFVDLNWERDQRVIGRIIPPGRVSFPTLLVWQRDGRGSWVKVELRGATAIREWAKEEKR